MRIKASVGLPAQSGAVTVGERGFSVISITALKCNLFEKRLHGIRRSEPITFPNQHNNNKWKISAFVGVGWVGCWDKWKSHRHTLDDGNK